MTETTKKNTGSSTDMHKKQTIHFSDAEVANKKVKDSGAKLIFGDPILCAQFLRGYTNIEILKDVQPEDITDISERFISMWHEERDSDSIKEIHLKGCPEFGSIFLITLIEHQSKVDYDMSFRILRYIVLILTDYAKRVEKQHPGITSSKGFQYPPIIPIVFYDGPGNWTASINFHNRTSLSDILGKYIPCFEYCVVPLSQYSNQDLIAKKDELSLVMLIDKLRSAADFRQLQEVPAGYLEEISRNSPDSLLQLIAKIISVLLHRLNVPKEEIAGFADQIERRDFAMLFENFEAYDVQETRRVSKEEGIRLGKAQIVLSFLSDLGDVSESLKERILSEKDPDLLTCWSKVAAKAASIDEFLSQCIPDMTE
nr:Rpn family recombination-promoting nuclease/putative transposase [uncultured Sellimonas sp.]